MKTIPASSSDAKSSCSARSFVQALAPRPKRAVVRDLDRLSGIAHAKNGRDRAENFFAISRRILRKIDKDGRLVKKSRAVHAITAGQQFRAGRDRFLHLLVHAVENLFRGERADLSRLIERIADFQRAHSLDKLIEKLVVNLVGDEKSFCRDARLAAVDRARFDRGGKGAFEICARHDDERIAAAELEHALFDFARGRARDRAARFLAAGERDRFHARIDNHFFDLLRLR